MARKAMLVLILLLGGIFLAWAVSGEDFAERDYIAYWSAGRLLLDHQNPYSMTATLAMERSAGFKHEIPNMLRNVPMALVLVLPLGFMDAQPGGVAWILLLLAVLMLCIRLLREVYRNQNSQSYLLGYIFAPTVACIVSGQSGLLLLLGLTLFLYWLERRTFWAGLALTLCLLKPHIFAVFLLVVVLWAVRESRWRVPAGLLCGFAITNMVALALRPSIWSDYQFMLRESRLDEEFLPTLSMLLRLAIHRDWIWLQFVPLVVGCIWAIWFYRQHRQQWSWLREGSAVMLVSALVSPYSWLSDEVVLLPAMLTALYAADERGRAVWPFALAVGVALIEIFTQVSMTSPWFIWTKLAWLGVYWAAMRRAVDSPVK